jgi:hypothetical protein
MLCSTATAALTHIAIQEQLDGKGIERMDKVRNEQYRTAEDSTCRISFGPTLPGCLRVKGAAELTVDGGWAARYA